ncbi:MAG: hypothetical protein K8Q97_02800 [Candidatus Andersenbacteria bacterium]|nr:hypothetical protein [Candidatus Andersenbacteria bacterium]
MRFFLKPYLIIAVLGLALPSITLAADVSVSLNKLSTISIDANLLPGTTASLVRQCKYLGSLDPYKDNTVSIPSDRLKLPLIIQYSYGSGLVTTAKNNYYSCSAEVIGDIQLYLNSSLSDFARVLISFFQYILSLINWLASFILEFLGNLVITMVGQGQYISSNLVQATWPFVQGLANLGFIVALLYIAFATTLRLESVSTSVQKLLPKLLIAALLVNFSLVIGGLMIDMSRVAMAVEINLMGGGQVTAKNFTAKLIERSEIVNEKVAGLQDPGTNSNFIAIMSRLIQQSFFTIALTAGMGIIAINLFVRYIALIMLLMVSPLAYLAFALPKTSGYASAWWGMFIKWVLYGPIVFFFLLIIIQVQNISPELPSDVTTDTSWQTSFNAMLHFIVVIALFFIANYAGKRVAGVGSDVAMGFANKTGAWARKNPKKAIGLGVGVMTGGVGAGVLAAGGAGLAQMGYTGARQQAGDFLGSAKDNLKGNSAIKKIREGLGYDLRDKEGKLLKGKSTLGSSFGNSLTSGLNTKVNKEVADIKALGTLTKPDDITTKAELLPSELSKGHVLKALGDTNVEFIMNKGGQSRRNAIAGNKDYVASLKPKDMAKLQTAILDSKDINDKEKTMTMEKIAKTVADLKK